MFYESRSDGACPVVGHMKIISFDPASFRNLGWAKAEISESEITVSADTYVTPDMYDVWQAYWPIFQFVDQFLSTELPDLVIVEKTSAFNSSSGPFVTGQVSHCMGVIYAACGKYGISVDFVLPTSVKMVVAGHGKATKSQIKKAIQYFVNNLTGDEKAKYSSEHAYDSVGNILYYLIMNNKIQPLEEFPWLTAKQLETVQKRKKKDAKKMDS